MNRRTGKIARFPKDLRELLNHMLDDGAQYTSIIHQLDKHRHRWPEHVNEITVNNLSTWHQGGYQDWVREQEVAADLNARHEFVHDLIKNTPAEKLAELTRQIGLVQLYHVLTSLNRDALEARFNENPDAYTRLLNALVRFNRTGLERSSRNAETPILAPDRNDNPEKSEHNSQSILSNSDQF